MADLNAIERKWQQKWHNANLGEAVRDASRPKFFMIFAYPGISGYLHVGHMRGFSYTDSICRFKRMRGYNVLFPVGTHASGNQAIAFANKVKNKDPAWRQYLLDNGCPEKVIDSMTDAGKVVDYFNTVYVEEYWKRFGFLCDWKRFTCTINLDYNAFIDWQFRKLHHAGLLTQKPYYATFCPSCGPVAVDPSETDLGKGGNAEKIEYTIIKFKQGDHYLVAASLRPETIFGQTNLWINAGHEYVKARVGSETWIMSGPCAEKLGYQKDSVEVISTISGKTLIGTTAHAPGVEREIIILPARFCDPHTGTGIVTSVPSDAPYDWIALRELQQNTEECKHWGLDQDQVQAIKPIPIIHTRGFGPHPAIEICRRMGITSQDDTDKLDAATQEVYKAGFHTGTMADSSGTYHGMQVAKAKEVVKQDLIASGQGDCFHDLTEEVICRCGAKVVIRKVDDQWFITYSDSSLTETSKKHAAKMTVLPKEYHHNIPHVLDWFSDRACARLGNWLGTKLPFDAQWTIEPISDSTIYPLYYLISGHVNEGTIRADQLTEAFFDYVVLGIGKSSDVSKTTKIPAAILDIIKQDIAYWYPLDINLGGKEHQTVHFPVFIMNHVGILSPSQWPRGIFVNWWVTGAGGKISKSKGGAQPIPGAIAAFGVDAMRLYYAHIGSPDTDVVWDEAVVANYRNTLNHALSLAQELVSLSSKAPGPIDRWLLSRIHSAIEPLTASFDSFNLREAATTIYYSLLEDVRWYHRRGGSCHHTIQQAMQIIALLMTPVTPHIGEEIYTLCGGKGLASIASWPTAHQSCINPMLESTEQSISIAIADFRNVIKLSKLSSPRQATLILPAQWTYRVYELLKKLVFSTRDQGVILKSIMAEENLRPHAKEITSMVQSALKDPSRLPLVIPNPVEEEQAFAGAVPFLEKEIGLKVCLERFEQSKHAKAGSALPGKPAIVIE